MSNPYAVLGDSLPKDAERPVSQISGRGKVVALASFVAGLGVAALCSGGAKLQFGDQQPTSFLTMPSTGLRKVASPYSLASLPGPTALKNHVLREIQARSGQCRPLRDVSMKAEGTELATESSIESYSKLMYSPVEGPASAVKVKEMARITAPFGLFDPLGISTKVPEGQLLFYREAELKHGRVCMLAILGLLVGESHSFIPLLGNGIDAKVPAYLLGTPFVSETPIKDFWAIALGAIFLEEWRHEFYRKQNPDAAPGDYGWDPLGLKPKDAKGMKELQNKELNNGRLAMFASAGIIAQEMIEGKNILR